MPYHPTDTDFKQLSVGPLVQELPYLQPAYRENVIPATAIYKGSGRDLMFLRTIYHSFQIKYHIHIKRQYSYDVFGGFNWNCL